MEMLDRIQRIDEAELDAGDYVNSLMKAAARVELLSLTALERIQGELLLLLARRTALYCGCGNSSVRVETAQAILDTNLYTIGVWLKSLPSPDHGAQALDTVPIAELYTLGRKRIATKLRVARQLHRGVVRTLLDVDNYAYRSTLVTGMAAFFRRYAPDFYATELHITCDYPLCCPVEGLLGVEFIQKYLDGALQENLFCGHFPLESLRRLFQRYAPDSGALIFSLFEQVLLTAIACVLTGSDPLDLAPHAGAVTTLQGMLLVKSRDEVALLVAEAQRQLTQSFAPPGGALAHYITRALPSVVTGLCAGVEHLYLTRLVLAV